MNPLNIMSIVTTPALHALIVLDEMPNFFADIALLLRMLAVYPYSTTPRLQFVALFSLPVCLKIVRLVAVGEIMYWDGTKTLQSATALKLASQSQVWVVISRVFDAVDNLYVSPSNCAFDCAHINLM
jgi:hypothetical protein